MKEIKDLFELICLIWESIDKDTTNYKRIDVNSKIEHIKFKLGVGE